MHSLYHNRLQGMAPQVEDADVDGGFCPASLLLSSMHACTCHGLHITRMFVVSPASTACVLRRLQAQRVTALASCI
jgi:hypothetical protein